MLLQPDFQAQDETSELDGLRRQIDSLKGELASMRDKVDGLKEETITATLAKITLQGGGLIIVSGGNGNWTIAYNGPQPSPLQATGACDPDSGNIIINIG